MPQPPMGYTTRTPIGALNTAEILVVMMIRLHTAARCDPAGPPADWRAGATAAGIAEDGARGFDALLQLLDALLRWPLDVRSLHYGALGEGEAWLLQTLALLQQGCRPQAEIILRRWLPARVARMAALQARRFARALAAQRLLLAPRDSVATALPPEAAGPRRLPALIH